MGSTSSTRHRFLWGILLIFIGLLFLFNNFDLFDIGDFIGTFWPLILIVIGVKIILGRKIIFDNFDVIFCQKEKKIYFYKK